MSDTTPSDRGIDPRQERINAAAEQAPFAGPPEEDFQPDPEAEEAVFGDALPTGVSSFPWHEKPTDGWPEGYSPFATTPKMPRLDDAPDDGEPDWETLSVEARERGYEEGYTKGHALGVEEGKVLGHGEGFVLGREEGAAEGFELGKVEAQESFADVGAAVDDLRALGAELESRLVRSAVELACRMVDQLVGRQFEESSELLVRQVGAAVQRFRGVDRCVLRVHPEDVAAMDKATELRRGADGLIEVVVEGDSSIRRGGWTLDTPMGGVDGTLDERVADILAAVERVDVVWDEPSAVSVIAEARARSGSDAAQDVDADADADADADVAQDLEAAQETQEAEAAVADARDADVDDAQAADPQVVDAGAQAELDDEAETPEAEDELAQEAGSPVESPPVESALAPDEGPDPDGEEGPSDA